MKRALGTAAALLLISLPAAAQTANPMSATLKGMFNGTKANLGDAAEQVPESEYGFKPTPEVRSFGQLIGHLANSNFSYCALAKGEKDPNTVDFEKDAAKADLVKGLRESFAYCDGVYGEATDAWLAQTVKTGAPGHQVERPRAFGLLFNITHNSEHYGNIVTYMRLKGHVPPSTAREQRRPSGR